MVIVPKDNKEVGLYLMRNRLSEKSERVVRGMIRQGRPFENPLSVMVREGARMMLLVALEDELT